MKLDQQLGWTGYLLNMTSQTWLNASDSTRHVWTHQILVVVPWNVDKSLSSNGALWITGGDNDDPGVPSNSDEDTLVCASLATSSGTVCAVLYQVPNQPIVFAEDPLQMQRSEDAAVAFTWSQFARVHMNNPQWVLYMPMAKAAARALDTVEHYCSTTANCQAPLSSGAPAPSKWMLFGASKRGATTWLAGAALGSSGRIIGIAPVVFDLLNFQLGVENMWRVLGGWTFAFTDYYAMNITTLLPNTTGANLLATVIDPLMYADNLTMPKLVVDATGDEFFQPTDDSVWWNLPPYGTPACAAWQAAGNGLCGLQGELLRMMIDNAEHSMATGALYLITGTEAWYAGLIRNVPRPTFTWTIDPNPNLGTITITATGVKPDQVVMRFATTVDGNTRRDFRLIGGNTPANPCKYINVTVFGPACLKPIFWVGEDVAPISSGPNGQGPWVYVLQQELPPQGWRGFLGEVYYPGPPGTNTTYQLTTQMSVIPNTYPFPPCYGDACIGELV